MPAAARLVHTTTVSDRSGIHGTGYPPGRRTHGQLDPDRPSSGGRPIIWPKDYPLVRGLGRANHWAAAYVMYCSARSGRGWKDRDEKQSNWDTESDLRSRAQRRRSRRLGRVWLIVVGQDQSDRWDHSDAGPHDAHHTTAEQWRGVLLRHHGGTAGRCVKGGEGRRACSTGQGTGSLSHRGLVAGLGAGRWGDPGGGLAGGGRGPRPPARP
jgi:hypothetical protein